MLNLIMKYFITGGMGFIGSHLVSVLISGKNLKINHLPPKTGDIPHSLSSTELAKKELDYVPKISLKKGLEDLLQSNSF